MKNNILKPDKEINQNRLAALAYASKFRWPVLPLHSFCEGKCTCSNVNCSSSGKHPLTQNGVKDASNDLCMIRGWWQKSPAANIGIAMGSTSGIFALDIDPRHYGDESLSELEEKHGKLPPTVEAITGSLGRHILYEYPKDMHVSNKVGIKPSLDIRGEGGYIVVAPSVHMSGRKYMWEHSSRPDEVAIAEAPEWLLKMLGTSKNCSKHTKKSTDEWKCLATTPAQVGERNSRLTIIIGHILRQNVNPYLAQELVKNWNRINCIPPLSDTEVYSIVESIAGKELERRKQIEK